MTTSATINDGIRAFRAAYARDRRNGQTRTLSEYLRLHRGDELLIAEEFLAFERDGTESGAFSESWPTISPERVHPGMRVGPYRVVRRIGRGGQASVYLAEEPRFNRRVALKLLSVDAEEAGESLLRFRREAEVASRLDHPGICPVFDAGCSDGVAYIAMRYVEGQTLVQLLRGADEKSEFVDFTDEDEGAQAGAAAAETKAAPRSRSDVNRFTYLIERAARAIHGAHEAGVVHRDVKPGNIMVTPDGDPVILDFGLAIHGETMAHALTRPGELYGTPSYMAPEQINAPSSANDPRVDVYALGVVLFECLTGRRPFEEANREALYHAITTRPAPDARQLNPAIPADLAIVIQTAMRKQPGARYANALELAEDLRRVREYEPIRARRVGPVGRLLRWRRRNPSLAVSLFAFLVLLIGSLGLTVRYLREEAEQSHRLASLLDEVRHERDAKEAAVTALEREREAKESFFDLVNEMLERRTSHRGIDGGRLEAAAPQPDVSVGHARRIGGARLAHPRATIDEARPIFEIEGSSLKALGDGVLVLRRDDGHTERYAIADEARYADAGMIRFDLPEQASLESGRTYTWSVVTGEAIGGLQRLLATPARFRVAEKDTILAMKGMESAAVGAAAAIDRAQVFLSNDLASAAKRELESCPLPEDGTTRELHLFLLGRAYAALGDRKKVIALRDGLRRRMEDPQPPPATRK